MKLDSRNDSAFICFLNRILKSVGALAIFSVLAQAGVREASAQASIEIHPNSNSSGPLLKNYLSTKALHVESLISISSKNLILMDLVSFSENLEGAWDLLQTRIDFLEFPNPDFQMTHQELHQKIRRSLGIQDWQDRVSFFVPAKVRFQYNSQSFPVQRFKNELVRHVLQQCGPCRVRVEDIKLPFGRWDSSVQFDFSKVGVQRNFLASVQQRDQKFHVSGSLLIQKQAYVSLRQLFPGDLLEPKDLRREWVSVSLGGFSDWSLDDLIGRRMATAKSPLQAIVKSDLQKQLLVSSGQAVKAILQSESFEISQILISEQSGERGDQVRLKSLDGKKILSGQVIDNQTVRVD
ncbi:MAG: flagellar basal body P-ring formation chaperone FlgA [Bdellovibrio sp.]